MILEFIEVVINDLDLFVDLKDKELAFDSLSKVIFHCLKANIPFSITVVFCLSLPCYIRLQDELINKEAQNVLIHV